MIILLSPAKLLDFSEPPEELEKTSPALLADTKRLAKTTKDLTRGDLSRLMGLSEKLAGLNFERFQAFKPSGARVETKQAGLAFAGDVYRGLEAATLSPEDLAFAQDHVRILSGFYGLLRPLDGIQPYRLEMGTKLANERGEDLYSFWGARIAKAINADLNAQSGTGAPVIVNLASNEYFKAVDKAALKTPVISPVFKEEKDGKLKSLMFYAKRARGLMARYAIQERITDPDALRGFNVEGYRYRPDLSSDADWVFTRPQPKTKATKAA